MKLTIDCFDFRDLHGYYSARLLFLKTTGSCGMRVSCEYCVNMSCDFFKIKSHANEYRARMRNKFRARKNEL